MSEAALLPEAYRRQMESQLGEQASAYFAALEAPYVRGLRLNPRKPIDPGLIDGLQEPVAWQAQNGRYLAMESAAGLDPLHEAGAYYIQEPSAMAAVAVLAPKPGERVLDLCAAPGGKSTQIADALAGQGLLAANEPVLSRAKILSRNLERMGVANALAVCAEPERLAPLWQGCFDAVLVDAPCSGEGMFRRHPETRGQWSEQTPAGCAARQKRILASAWRMLRPGGRLVYSTCTFNPEENEGVVGWLLAACPDARPVPFTLPLPEGRALKGERGTLHLYPHQLKGEGHFVALVRKLGDTPVAGFMPAAASLTPPAPQALAAYRAWAQGLGGALPLPNAQLGEMLIAAPELPPLKGVKVLRAGLQLGTLKGKSFWPDHALALGLPLPYALPLRALSPEEAKAYLRGESLQMPADASGYGLAAYQGLALGFGKASDGQLKNHYPKGLRRP